MKELAWIVWLAVVVSCTVNAAETDDRIVFKGSNASVSYADLERYLQDSLPPEPEGKAAVLARPGIYKEMAESLYTIRALAADAEAMPEFDREQAQWMANLMYQKRIIAQYREFYTAQALKDVNWDALAKETYQVNKADYVTPEGVSAAHILIKVDESRSEEEASVLATEIRERVLSGEDFGKLAREYSDDPSAASNAGNLGLFKRGQMVKPFEDVVFEMDEPGAISEPVRTSFGYHVIRFDSRKPSEQIPFEAVKKNIIKDLRQKMSDRVWQDKLAAVRSATDIVVDESLLQDLSAQIQPAQSGR